MLQMAGMGPKAQSIVATVIAIAAAGWHFREISHATAHVPAGPFPWIPATITLVSVILALHWWQQAKESDD